MAVKKSKKKVTIIHEHPRRVPVSNKNPSGITIVDDHLRRVPGTSLSVDEMLEIAKNYNKNNIPYPTAKKLKSYPNADNYDELIAIWTDYFNKKLSANPSLDADVIKALIGSESGFQEDPIGNKTALGIAQITKQTLKILQNQNGEAKDFIFKKIRQKDLKNPDIAIPMAIRWLIKKQQMAERKLKRLPTHEETILEYKGLLKSKSSWKTDALVNYKEKYETLKSK